MNSHGFTIEHYLNLQKNSVELDWYPGDFN